MQFRCMPFADPLDGVLLSGYNSEVTISGVEDEQLSCDNLALCVRRKARR